MEYVIDHTIYTYRYKYLYPYCCVCFCSVTVLSGHRRSPILFHPCQDLICPFNGNNDVVSQWICMNQRPPVNPGVEDSPVRGFQRGGGGSYVTCLMTFRVICFQECMLLSSCLICITLVGVWGNAACMVLSPLLVSWNGPQNSKIRGCQEAVGGGKHSWIFADGNFSGGS